jgi:ribosomal protein S19E (S16A)
MEHVKNVAPDRLEDMITREIRSVRNKETHFVDIVKTIEAREACIIEIRKVLVSDKLFRKILKR